MSMDGRTLGGKTAMFLIIGLFMVVFLALFGTSYAVVGVTVASAAMIMLSKDLSVRPFSNLCSIMVFMVLMGVGAFLASLDPYLGLLVNFIVVFLVVFLSMQDLKSPMHFPMLLVLRFHAACWAAGFQRNHHAPAGRAFNETRTGGDRKI